MNKYGLDINTIQKFINKPLLQKKEWGSRLKLGHPADYELEKIEIKKNKKFSFKNRDDREITIFAEKGFILIDDINLASQELITLEPTARSKIKAIEDSILYIFSGSIEKNKYFKKSGTSDCREKYWGKIETIVSKNYVGKRIFLRKGKNSSLEFHCRKTESYFIHSGEILIRLRAGRGEDKFFKLKKGDALFTPPGLMHQRGGLKDAVIIEISTRDEDSDSFLVEDGQKYKMPNPPLD